jgi:hypothetical protein
MASSSWTALLIASCMCTAMCACVLPLHTCTAVYCRGLYRSNPTWVHPPEVIPADSWRDDSSGGAEGM